MSATLTYQLRVDDNRLVRATSFENSRDWPTHDERRHARVLCEAILRGQLRESGERAQFRYPPVRPEARP